METMDATISNIDRLIDDLRSATPEKTPERLKSAILFLLEERRDEIEAQAQFFTRKTAR